MIGEEKKSVQPVSLPEAIASTAAQLRQSTVQVRTGQQGMGSGVIWSADGVIITNAHVVTGASATVELSDGRVLEAAVTARNRQRDLVALQVKETDLPAATIGDSRTLRVGSLVFAIGNPWGMAGALTTGIIHTLGTHRGDQPWIQADIQLAPGNSGGALANAQGEVIGINTMIVKGRGFAVPSHVVQQFLSRRGERPYLGVTMQPIRLRLGRRRAIGLLITTVEPNSPAAHAQLQPGDVLIGVRRALFQSVDELTDILENSQVGDGLPLDVLRGNQQGVVDVVLCSKDSQPQAA